ncbi:unnamed protein product [Coregonus sp. 'balchen']|nr:unnamed protein product [Coregonus sp. 'balchen']
MYRDLLVLLVENISGLEEDNFSLEIIRETNIAVVTFNKPNDAEQFLTNSKSNKHFMKHGLIGRELERSGETIKDKNQVICKVQVNVYLYYESLGQCGSLLNPFTESLHPALWSFLSTKRQSSPINDQLKVYFCQVDVDSASTYPAEAERTKQTNT